LQAPWAKARLGLDDKALMEEMKLLTEEGKVFGGADALLRIARGIWWAWPLFALSLLPGVRPSLRFVYRRVAQNRYCIAGSCPAPPPTAHHHHHGASSFYELP
jgi:predicted DCC family thiol-disulfide oxidoreductase YuxK